MKATKRFCPKCGSLCFYSLESCITCMYAPEIVANRPLPECPLILAYGMGVDSTAVIVEFVRLGVRPDLILFADTGGEKRETYAYRPIIDRYLKKHGFPQVTVVKAKPPKRYKWGRYTNLEEKCLINETLPSIAYGGHSCADVFKIKPQNAFCSRWEPAMRTWRLGKKVVKVIGYDAGAADAKRAYKIEGKGEDDKYHYWYPLREWGYDREKCKEVIAKGGLPVPPKSACFYCPASKKHEIEWLRDNHPDLYERALKIERTARDGRHGIKGSTKGLGRHFSWEAKCGSYAECGVM
jgi:hypothetical protein